MGNYNDEKRELLKLKQGLIEESELIPENVHEALPELHGMERVKNEIFHLGWALPVIIGVVALAIFIITQLAGRKKEDLRVLIVPAAANSEMTKFSDNTEVVKTALEKFCADYDGNGEIYVAAPYVDITETSENREYLDMQYERFNTEVFAGTAVLILADPELLDKLNEAYENELSAFVDFSGEFPEEKLYKGCGVRIAGTSLAEEIGCETAVLFVRDKLGNGGEKKTARYRDRAVEVLKSIVGANT